jgi:hypothetical protein
MTVALAAFRWLVGLGLLLAVGACSNAPANVYHSFSFDTFLDSPDTELLDYKYGDSNFPGAANPEDLRKEGTAIQRININGRMRRGDVLFVKWRVRSTGKVYEKTVALKSRLPQDISDHRIHFIADGSELYVYLISPERRADGLRSTGPLAYRQYIINTIYPDQIK